MPAGLALIGLAVALWAGEARVAWGFAACAGGGGLVGGALAVGLRASRAESALLGRGHGAGPAVALGWLAAAALAAVPFWVSGTGAAAGAAVFASPANALFEAMSGLTSTGLSVAPDASALPHGLQGWRSLLQWVGGVGILYVALGLVPGMRAGHAAELDEELDTRAVGGVRRVAAVWGLYAGYTAAVGVAYGAAGMPAWEAVNHALTTVATGGFAVTADSFAGYGRGVHAVAVVGMALGAVSFGTHAAVVLRRRPGAVAADAELRLLLALFVLGALALALAVRLGDGLAFPDAAFLWASALFTAGFSTADVGALGALPLLLLALAMAVGGSTGSTAGGLKQGRVLWLARWARGGLSARDVDAHARPARRLLGWMAGALALGTASLVAFGAAPVAALFEATSALATVGLSTGVTGAEAPLGTRLTLVALMWAGRLEVAAVVALLIGRWRE